MLPNQFIFLFTLLLTHSPLALSGLLPFALSELGLLEPQKTLLGKFPSPSRKGGEIKSDSQDSNDNGQLGQLVTINQRGVQTSIAGAKAKLDKETIAVDPLGLENVSEKFPNANSNVKVTANDNQINVSEGAKSPPSTIEVNAEPKASNDKQPNPLAGQGPIITLGDTLELS